MKKLNKGNRLNDQNTSAMRLRSFLRPKKLKYDLKNDYNLKGSKTF